MGVRIPPRHENVHPPRSVDCRAPWPGYPPARVISGRDMAGDIVLVIGSGPDALAARAFPRAAFDTVLAINNAWRVRPDWDILIHPEDFPPERQPVAAGQAKRVVTADDYVPVQNRYGGFVYAGGTMAMTAGYWALGALRPRVLAWFGCDMVYPEGPRTHFYGAGAADPLRRDVSLRNLEAKSARLMLLAARQGARCVNLSDEPSRLVFPRARPADLRALSGTPPAPVGPATSAALRAERRLGYMVPSGRYWEVEGRFDPVQIDEIDQLWLDAAAEHQGLSRYPVRNQLQASASTAAVAPVQTARPSQGELSETPMNP
jgi:hypothetical protein